LCPFSKSDCETGEYGFIDTTGKEVIPQIYDSLGGWSEGLCSVEKDGKSGVIDKTGTEVIPLGLYDYVWSVGEGLCGVRKGDKWGFINKQGVSPFPPPEF